MALDWTSLGTIKFDLRPRLSGVGQTAALGSNSAASVPSGTFIALTALGFPMQVSTSCAGLTAFGFGPNSDGTTGGQGASLNSITVPSTNPQNCTIAVLAEMNGSKSDTTYATTDGRQNQGLFSWEGGGNSGAAIGMNRALRFANGAGPAGGDWWAWNASSLRVPCNLQLMVFRRSTSNVTINTAASVSEVVTTTDTAVATQSFSAGSLQGNNVCIGKIVRWTVWNGLLTDGNVTSLYNDVYSTGGLAPSEYRGDIVLLGDSLTAGYYPLPGQSWVDHLLSAAHAAKHRVWNYARAGEKLNGGSSLNLANAIASTNGSTLTQSHLKFLFGNAGENFPSRANVVLMLGTNDIAAVGSGVSSLTGAQICLGLQAACQLLKNWGARIYVVAPPPVKIPAWGAGIGATVETLRREYITAAQALVGNEVDAFMTWDGTDIEPVTASDAEVAAVTTGPNYQLFTSTSSNLMHTSNKGDGIHPGPIGQRLLGGAITRFVMQQVITNMAGSGSGRILRASRI